MGKVRIAMIGCGGIANSHAAGYEQLTDLGEVVYCCDPRLEGAQKLAERLGGQAAASYAGILDQVDAVDICTPHHLHFPAARDALLAGKHVFVEKPLANTRAECRELVRLAAQRNLRLMSGYVLRYMPAMQKLKDVLAAGTYGPITQIATSVEARVGYEHLPWAAEKAKLGGGVMFSHGCHTIDLMVWLGGPVRRVAMLGNNLNGEWMEGESTAQMIFEFASGALGHHTSSWAMPHTHAIPWMRVWCRDGYLEVCPPGLAAWVKGEQTVLHAAPEGEPSAMQLQLQHYLECVRDGSTPLTDGAASLPSLEVIWAAHESRETGRMVTL
ncbi:MAG: Gfo/Idh/MocA family oxidoreductase [Armatimonadetes bacterium]|nr:Gfo/Idh/MocA family oxidoreductase [Armatimonadota bacterium]